MSTTKNAVSLRKSLRLHRETVKALRTKTGVRAGVTDSFGAGCASCWHSLKSR